MKLPRQIPRHLRQDAIYLHGFVEGEAAWSKDDALEVIASLRGTNTIVAGVSILTRTLLNEVITGDSWAPARSRGELGTEYAARTHLGAREFIASHDVEGEDTVFALRFPPRKEAA